MSKLFEIHYDNAAAVFRVSGELVFESVNDLLLESALLFDKAPSLTVDLAEVSRSDSTGLALLVDWTRRAKQQHKSLILKNVPKQTIALAKATGLDEILPVEL